ncbi:hypothetical protein [Anaeromyxobacter oryzae]|uniref:PepSY domain-containing protein n=1 Tax=Anaeromyxobacter oryzae TaxID=2918170 RepID=A0ABM7WV30_9BACT|nr:hypothetical protein [Anaeromyxobacter oryzae]BDG03363.1 hypothetical protein AMOR_23590 [Anaeromyxobacter oryzae]
MRAPALAGLLLLGGCVTYVRPYPAPVPPPAPAESPAPPPRPAPRAYIAERQAIDIAFEICRDRGLSVETVHRAHLDGAGRWHLDLRGRDRATLLLDARDGRLMKGQFRQRAQVGGDEEWQD